MKHKVLGSVFVLAVALGVIGVATHGHRTMNSSTPIARTSAAKDTPNMDRALKSFRVFETELDGGIDFRGASYTATVAQTGVRFGHSEGSILLGAPVLEQGGRKIGGSAGLFSHAEFGKARLEREGFTEEYLLENHRMEQIFRIPSPIGEGALKVRVPVTVDFPCVIETKKPNSGRFDAPEFTEGGIAFLNPKGELKTAYHSAVAFDAGGGRITLYPRHENNEIVLDVPASFMAQAKYPVVVDPWFVNIGSGSGGISGTGTASERPSFKNNVIAWADHSSGNFEIYVRLWTGTGFNELAGSASGGGISGNAGQSLNPSVASDNKGLPTVAWEDTSGGARSIYVRSYNGTSWVDYSGSGSLLGVTGGLNVALNPSCGILVGRVPGVVTDNPNGGPPISTPPETPMCPVVAFDLGGAIIVTAHYPGAPAQPVSSVNPQGLAAVPAGWYQLGAQPNGINVNKNTFSGAGSPSGFSAAGKPQLVVDGNNQVTVAWEQVGTGNFEIFASRWTLAGAGATEFEIRAQQNLTTMNMLPAANWQGLAAPGNLNDNVSNTATPSQYPSLCQDILGGLSIAWQETENGGPSNPATSSQIYLRRFAGAGWASIAGSASPGGISRTGLSYDGAAQVPPVPGNASTPSVDAGFNYLGVAWADTSNSRSSIYVRRCRMVGGTEWEQVGFQGSAFPPRTPLILPPAVPEQAPISGISQSNSFSFQPQIQMDFDDSPFVVWADGSAATFDIFTAKFYPNGPGQAVGIGSLNPTFQLTIRQTQTDPSLPGGAIDVPFGDFTTGASIWLSSRVFTETITPPGTSLWLEFEIQPEGVPFALQATHQSLFVAPDVPPTTLPVPAPTSLSVLKFDGLPNTNYHYITRSIDQAGRSSPWFEQTNVSGVSFRVNSTATGSGPVNIAPVVVDGGNRSKGNCGLLGLEAAALLGLMRLLRRKRSQ